MPRIKYCHEPIIAKLTNPDNGATYFQPAFRIIERLSEQQDFILGYILTGIACYSEEGTRGEHRQFKDARLIHISRLDLIRKITP